LARKPRYTPSTAPADKHGFTIIALLAQSHLSLHTWPEYGYLVLDIFTGRDQEQADHPADHFLPRLRPGRVNRQVLSRGFH
jgi:S-adenosylmethionine decarboxylase